MAVKWPRPEGVTWQAEGKGVWTDPYLRRGVSVRGRTAGIRTNRSAFRAVLGCGFAKDADRDVDQRAWPLLIAPMARSWTSRQVRAASDRRSESTASPSPTGCGRYSACRRSGRRSRATGRAGSELARRRRRPVPPIVPTRRPTRPPIDAWRATRQPFPVSGPLRAGTRRGNKHS